VTGANTSTLSLILLVIGGAGVLGTYWTGICTRHGFTACSSSCRSAHGGEASLLAAWGPVGTAAPVGRWTWLSKKLPDDAEAGGLMAAVIQFAIALGASSGGMLFDHEGYQGTFAFSASIPVVSAAAAAFCARRARSGPSMQNRQLEECLP
jgi:predicted MFS family arabinose efflux permease